MNAFAQMADTHIKKKSLLIVAGEIQDEELRAMLKKDPIKKLNEEGYIRIVDK